MMHELLHIRFEDFIADPQRAFDEVRQGNGPVFVERNGETYRLERDVPVDPWGSYDPETALQGLRAAVGALHGVDVDELLADLRAQRGQDTQGRPA